MPQAYNMEDRNMKVYFYWNLHRGLWSRMVRGKVTGRVASVVAKDVEFRVRPAGFARVLRERKKNVHAFAVASGTTNEWARPAGALVADDFNGQPAWVEVSYNPFRGPTFYRKDTGETVTGAEMVALTSDKRVFARGVK